MNIMVKINGKFLKYQEFGNKLAEKICLGWKPTIEILDCFGNGQMLFEHREYCTVVVPFTEINVNDTVTVEYNNLCEIKRLYK